MHTYVPRIDTEMDWSRHMLLWFINSDKKANHLFSQGHELWGGFGDAGNWRWGVVGDSKYHELVEAVMPVWMQKGAAAAKEAAHAG